MKALVLIPTYNEAANIERLMDSCVRASGSAGKPFDILFIDDNSPDGTAAVIKSMGSGRGGVNVHLLERPGKAGLAAAYLAGFEWGASRGYELLIEMDADLSHDPAYLPEVIARAESCDFVVCSRYVKGGGVEGWGLMRRLVSRGGSLFSQIVLGCPIRDLTGGFNAWKASTLRKIDLSTIFSKGYAFQIEMKYRAFKRGCVYAEMPIMFKDRELGQSKMSKAIFREAFLNVLRMKKEVR